MSFTACGMRRALATALVVAVAGLPPARGDAAPGDEITPGALRVDVTFQSIGVYWPVTGDNNRNATLALEYRPAGTASWFPGATAMRAVPTTIVDGVTLGLNHLAASALLLSPGTTYELRATVADPDGGGTQQIVTATTRREPTASPSSNVRYVVPGVGGGSGTSGDPYRGLQAAAGAANPGDVFEVAPGTYAPFTIIRSGTASAPIVFRGPASGVAVVDGANTSRGVVTIGSIATGGSHVIIERLTIQNGLWGIDADSTSNITIRGNVIRDVGYGIVNRRGNDVERNQTIVDNVISGRTPWPGAGIPAERGIDLRGYGNVVAYNRVDHFGDCVSVQPSSGMSYGNDVVGNDASYCVDDGIEIDDNVANVRVWRNRVTNARMGVSIQPIKGGPAYIFRNELLNLESNPIKMNNQPSGFVVAHNTSVKHGPGLYDSAVWRNAIFRNNVMIGDGYAFEFVTAPDEGFRDFDYNAWGSPRPGTTAEPRFKWNNVRYPTIAGLQAIGVESHGREITAATLENATLSPTWDVAVAPGALDVRPRPGTAPVNAGVPLGNMDVGFVADGAPDMGAYELGQPVPSYGPRPGVQPPAPPAVPSRFVSYGPARQFDTRQGEQGGRHPGRLTTRVYTMPDLPPEAVAATFTLTAVDPSGNGYVSAFPCAGGTPETSILNYQPDRPAVPNQITVTVSARQVCILAEHAVDLIVDLAGWWVPNGGGELLPEQRRLWDTRTQGGDGAGTVLRVPLGAPPAGIGALSGVSVNLTSTEGRAVGYLTAYDCAGGFPLASNVNYSPGITTANLATIALAPASRDLCVYSSDPTEIVVDLLGWWGAGSGRRTLSSLASPSRLVDTRQPGSPIARLAPFQPVQIHPPTNRTLYANITAVGADSGGYVAVYPCAAGWAGTSTVNFRFDVPVANTTWIDASTGVCAFADRSTHLLMDVFAEMTN